MRVAGPLDCNYLNPSFRFGKTGFYLACAGWNIDFLNSFNILRYSFSTPLAVPLGAGAALAAVFLRRLFYFAAKVEQNLFCCYT